MAIINPAISGPGFGAFEHRIWEVKVRLVVLFLFLLLTALPSQAKIVDYIAAVVNGEPILYSEVVSYAKENGIPDLRVARDKLIEKKILLTQAESEGLKVSDSEVQRALKSFMVRNGIKNEKELSELLRKEGLTLNDLKEKIREQLLIAKLIARDVKSKVSVSDGEVEMVCQKEEGKPVRDVYYIYTKSRSVADKAMELLSNGVPFEKVARELSEDRETASKGGHIGKVTPGMLIKPLDQAVWSIKPGNYKLVRTSDGFYIVYVKSEERGHCDREKIRQQLYMMKFQKALKDYLDNLKRSASVKVYM